MGEAKKQKPKGNSGIRNLEYWRETILAWQRSGKTQARFCEERELSHHVFRDRLYRLRKLEPDFARVRRKASDGSTSSVNFFPVRVVAEGTADKAISALPTSHHEDRPLVVRLAGTKSIEVSGDFDETIFRKLVRVLEDPSC